MTNHLNWEPSNCDFPDGDYCATDSTGRQWRATYRCTRTDGKAVYWITCDLREVVYFGVGLPSAFTDQDFIPASVPSFSQAA